MMTCDDLMLDVNYCIIVAGLDIFKGGPSLALPQQRQWEYAAFMAQLVPPNYTWLPDIAVVPA